MAIRDYLLTKLRLRADEQQRALEIERQRAQTEANIYNAQVQALAKVADAGTSLVGMGAKSFDATQAARAASIAEEADLQAKLQAARDIESATAAEGVQPELPLPEGSFKGPKLAFDYSEPTTPTGQVTPAATAATQNLFDDLPKAGGQSKVPPAPAVAEPSWADKLLGSAKSFDQLVKEMPAGGPTANIPYTDEQMAAMTPGYGGGGVYSRREVAGNLAPIPEADVRPDTTAALPPSPEKRPSVAAEIKEADDRAIDAAYKKIMSVPLSELGMESPEQRAARLNTVEPAVDTSYIPTMPVPGLAGLSVPRPTFKTSPVETPVPSTGTASDIPDIPDFKLQYGIDLNKPAVRKAVEEAPAITGYKPLTFEKAGSPQEEAKKIVDQVWEKQPPGNPLTEFFNHGKRKGDMDRARRMAELKTEMTIRDTRKQLQAEHEANYLRSLDIKKAEEQIGLIRAQSALATSKSENVLRLETKLPPGDRKDLDSAYMASDKLNQLKDSTAKLIETKGSIPIGPIREYQKAMAQAAGIDVGTSTTSNIGAQISAQLGIGAGGGVGMSTTKGGKRIDAEAYRKAFEAMDKLNLTPEEQQFMNEYHQSIQIIGKAREGGRMTDADARNYEKMLFATSSPQAFVNSLNDLGATQSGVYNRTYGIISRNYDLGDVYPGSMEWQPLVLSGPIGETAVSPQAMSLPIPAAPLDRVGPIISGMSVEQLTNLLNNSQVDSDTKKAVQDEINKKRASRTPSTKPKSGVPNPLE